ncbi:MAG: dienelactone hydrolase family protein [Oscillospiraceae bacterium]|nr:dienelactone hydrolase family protein [Oscillospiraceae bacterium]
MSGFEVENLRQRNEYVGSIENLLENLKYGSKNNRLIKEKDKEALRGKYIGMLGYPLTCGPCANNSKCYEKTGITAKKEHLGEYDNMIMTRFQLEVMPDFWFYGILYEPKENPKGKDALVIAQHGGLGTPEIIGGLIFDSANYNHLVQRIIRKGIKVFAPQLLLWGQDVYKGANYNRLAIDKKLKMYGGSITALEIYCIMRSIDYFSALDDVDENRIGMLGVSYGGMYALHTAAADVRIKAALSSCWFNDRLKYLNDDWSYFNQANAFFDAEVGYLVLPRKLYIEIAAKDELFDPESAGEDIKRLRQYAEDENCADSLKIKIFDGVHEFDKGDEGVEFFLGNL